MINIQTLYNQLRQSNGKVDYSALSDMDNRVHVLFVAPKMNTPDLYKMILPAIELNQTGRFHCVINQIHEYDPSTPYSDYTTELDAELIKWADIIVFGWTTEHIAPTIKSLKEINPALRVYFSIDYDFTSIPKAHTDYKQVTDGYDAIIDTIRHSDVILVNNLDLIKRLGSKIKPDLNGKQVETGFVPPLVSDIYHKVEIPQQVARKTVKIGIVQDGLRTNLTMLQKPLDTLKSKYKDKIQFVIVDSSSKANPYKKIDGVKMTPEIDLSERISKLSELKIDIAVIPMRDNVFNETSQAYIPYLEFSAIQVPVIAPMLPIYASVIISNEHGRLCDSQSKGVTWVDNISQLIEDVKQRHAIGRTAYNYAWGEMNYKKHVDSLAAIFS